MPDTTAVQRFLQWFTVAAYATLLLKIYFEPALHRYRYFAVYLAAQAIRAFVTLWFSQYSMIYGWIYVLSAPVIWVCYVLVVFEIYSLVLDQYKGIATFSRYTLSATLGLSVLVSGSTLIFDLSSHAERFPILLAVFVGERWVVSSLLMLLIALTAFLLWFPVPLSRNVVVYSLLYFLYFLSKALALFFRNTMGPAALNIANLAVMCAASVCLVVWILFLNREGERQEVKHRIHWDPDSEKRLLHQLDSINAALLRSARK